MTQNNDMKTTLLPLVPIGSFNDSLCNFSRSSYLIWTIFSWDRQCDLIKTSTRTTSSTIYKTSYNLLFSVDAAFQVNLSYIFKTDRIVVGPILRVSGFQADWAPDNRAPDSWAPGPICPGPNCPGLNCPGQRNGQLAPRIFWNILK